MKTKKLYIVGYHINFIHHVGFLLMKETGNISIHVLLHLSKQLIYTYAETEHMVTTWQTLFTTRKHHLQWTKHASVRQMVILFMS